MPENEALSWTRTCRREKRNDDRVHASADVTRSFGMLWPEFLQASSFPFAFAHIKNNLMDERGSLPARQSINTTRCFPLHPRSLAHNNQIVACRPLDKHYLSLATHRLSYLSLSFPSTLHLYSRWPTGTTGSMSDSRYPSPYGTRIVHRVAGTYEWYVMSFMYHPSRYVYIPALYCLVFKGGTDILSPRPYHFALDGCLLSRCSIVIHYPLLSFA